jgi:hypothetical protein
LLGSASGPRREEDYVRLVRIQLAERPISDAALADYFSALKFEVSDIGKLLFLGKRENCGK